MSVVAAPQAGVVVFDPFTEARLEELRSAAGVSERMVPIWLKEIADVVPSERSETASFVWPRWLAQIHPARSVGERNVEASARALGHRLTGMFEGGLISAEDVFFDPEKVVAAFGAEFGSSSSVAADAERFRLAVQSLARALNASIWSGCLTIGQTFRMAAGEPAVALLRDGWSAPEENYTWSDGPQSTIAFRPAPPATGRLRCCLRGFVVTPGLDIVVERDGAPLGRFDFPEGAPREVEIDVELADFSPSETTLNFRYSNTTQPDNGDRRDLAFALSTLRLYAASGEDEPVVGMAVRSVPPELFLPEEIAAHRSAVGAVQRRLDDGVALLDFGAAGLSNLRRLAFLSPASQALCLFDAQIGDVLAAPALLISFAPTVEMPAFLAMVDRFLSTPEGRRSTWGAGARTLADFEFLRAHERIQGRTISHCDGLFLFEPTPR